MESKFGNGGGEAGNGDNVSSQFIKCRNSQPRVGGSCAREDGNQLFMHLHSRTCANERELARILAPVLALLLPRASSSCSSSRFSLRCIKWAAVRHTTRKSKDSELIIVENNGGAGKKDCARLCS